MTQFDYSLEQMVPTIGAGEILARHLGDDPYLNDREGLGSTIALFSQTRLSLRDRIEALNALPGVANKLPDSRAQILEIYHTESDVIRESIRAEVLYVNSYLAARPGLLAVKAMVRTSPESHTSRIIGVASFRDVGRLALPIPVYAEQTSEVITVREKYINPNCLSGAELAVLSRTGAI